MIWRWRAYAALCNTFIVSPLTGRRLEGRLRDGACVRRRYIRTESRSFAFKGFSRRFSSRIGMELNGNSMRSIGTHDGTFHCDEALACYMLRQLDGFKDGKLVRSRDENVLKDLDCVVDVGGVYDTKTLRFDHHQRGFFETFDEKRTTKLSSAGLVYKHMGREVIQSILGKNLPEDDMEKVYVKVYTTFIEEVDGNDNGVPQYETDAMARYEKNTSLPARVSRLNPSWRTTEPDFDSGFNKAMELTGSELTEAIQSVTYEWLPGQNIVREAILKRFEVDPSGEIVLLERMCPWKSHLHQLEVELGVTVPIKYMIYVDSAKRWRVQCVNVEPGSFESRKPMPAAWRGIRDDELTEVTQIPGCVFVHMSGFIGGNETKEGALAMARASLHFEEADVSSTATGFNDAKKAKTGL